MKAKTILLSSLGVLGLAALAHADGRDSERYMVATTCKATTVPLEFEVLTQVPFFNCFENAIAANRNIWVKTKPNNIPYLVSPGQITDIQEKTKTSGYLYLGVNDSRLNFEIDFTNKDKPTGRIVDAGDPNNNSEIKCSPIPELMRKKCGGPR